MPAYQHGGSEHTNTLHGPFVFEERVNIGTPTILGCKRREYMALGVAAHQKLRDCLPLESDCFRRSYFLKAQCRV